ncbi:MAG TPA: PQQ-dependent sugar dehydrogenase [Nitrososphaera sp.]|nr:PQQ-dependent sugar dehydrogenase [Nitrososphaera sp.]
MDRKQAIIFSMIAATVVVSASISLSYVGLSNGGFDPRPANNTGAPVPNNTTVSNNNDIFSVLPDPNPPTISDPGLKVEKVIEGLALPTSMAFLDHDDILILQKDNGRVRLVSDGALQPDHVFEVSVENNNERGLLGVAIANATGTTAKTVYLYYTEQAGDEVRNRVYRYDLDGAGNITGGTLVLDLPGQPGPNHDGGKIAIGPDGMLFAVIGDLNRNGVLQNYRSGPEPDNTSVILRVDRNGNAVNGTSKYYAYGIRNSFGIDFDPLTGVLWDSENGPADYDEINVVEPGFNSGWEQVMGPIARGSRTADSLVQLEGSHYADPVFSWRQAEGITDIEFLNSTKLGERYAHNIFVGDIKNGNLYFFTVNDERDGLELGNGGLEDLVADNNSEVEEITFGTGFPGITDIETGPDGYLYILTFGGNLYRIMPAS